MFFLYSFLKLLLRVRFLFFVHFLQPDLSNFDPSKIELDPLEVEAIKNSVDNNKFATPEQREKMFNAIILDLKTQKYVKDNNLSH